MKSLVRLIITCLLLTVGLSLQAQMESRLTYRRYTTQDGLPQMQAERLWQDSRGYIYIGTLSGFVRFDGKMFTPFLKGRRLNIVGFAEVDGEARALGFFRQWTVGYDDIMAMPLDPQGHWLLNNLNAGSLPNGYVLTEDSLETHCRLCRLTRQGLETILTGTLLDEMTPDRRLYLDSTQVLIPTSSGLYQVTLGSHQAQRLTSKPDIYTLLRTDAGLLAFASDGIYQIEGNGKRVEGKRLRRLAEADWQAASYGLVVRPLRNGNLMIADEHTIYLYDGTAVGRLFTGINLIRDVLVDRWDRLWVATYEGVYCFFNRCFTNHQLTDESDIVRAIAVDDVGRLVMGSLNGKVMVAGRGAKAEGQRSLDNGYCLLDDPGQFFAPSAVNIGGKVYMAGNGDIACVSDSALRWLHLPRDRYQFVATAWQRLIVGTRTGILAYDPKTATLDTLTSEILHPWCASQGRDSLLWVGSSSGLFSITKDRRVRKVEYADQKLIVTTLAADSQGTVYFASADSVFTVRHNKVEPLNPQLPQLSGHEIRSLHVSPKGYLVVAVVDGLFVGRLSAEGLVSDFRFFNHLNGFTMTEPLKAQMGETADGTVWLAGVEQMTSFRPSDLLSYRVEDTYIAPPLRWWQHWWVWLVGLLLIALTVWASTRWYEKRRNRQRMIRLQREKLRQAQQIEAIRQIAIEAEQEPLAKEIMKMTEKTFAERIALRTASGTIVAEVKDIACFKGDGNYSRMVTFNGEETVFVSLGALVRMLNPESFVRADRSTLVNIHNVSQLMPRQRRCIFRSPDGRQVETTLLAPAFKRLQDLL